MSKVAVYHRVHWTSGILRQFQAVFWPRVFLLPSRVHTHPPASDAYRWKATTTILVRLYVYKGLDLCSSSLVVQPELERE